MSVLANNNELLKYIEIWYEIKVLFNKKFNKKVFQSKPIYTKISPYNKHFHGYERLTKDEYMDIQYYY